MVDGYPGEKMKAEVIPVRRKGTSYVVCCPKIEKDVREATCQKCSDCRIMEASYIKCTYLGRMDNAVVIGRKYEEQ